MAASSARYRILRRLGQGGMAEVFEAELVGELGFVRKVAIKRMLAEVARDSEMAVRFLDEARIASRLHHASIVSVVDMGLLDGLPFQVLEFIDGIDVHQLQHRAGGRLPLEVALIIANDVAHALDHAHAATDAQGHPLGIVHRDVKPPNVLVSWNGDVKLTDFGIAFARDREVRTEAGLVPGTMGFIAPEHRLKGVVDGRADVFALGLTLHAMLTGYTPLSDVAVEMSVLSGSTIPLDATLSSDLREVIARAVTPEKRDRFTASELADALGALLAPKLPRDPRGYLRDFLAPLRDSKPKPGALDRLLGLDVVLVTDDQGGPRQYTLQSQTATVLARPERAPETNQPPRRRIGRWLAAAVALGSLGGFAAWRLQTESRAAVPPLPPQELAHAITAPPADATVAPIADATAAPIADAASVDLAAELAPTRSATRPRTKPSPTTKPVSEPTSQATPSPVGTGFVQVVGEDNLGARVLVDGRDAGYAPNKLEVKRGHHRIEVIRTSGERITADIDITEYHTVQHPLQPAL